MSEKKPKKPLPIVGIVEKLETIITTKKGKVHQLYAMDKGLIHDEEIEYKPKNPDLRYLCQLCDRLKIYYNVVNDEFWLCSIKRLFGKTRVISEWYKLENHDFNTMLALGFMNDRNFDRNRLNPHNAIRIKKRHKTKIMTILDKFEGKEAKK